MDGQNRILSNLTANGSLDSLFDWIDSAGASSPHSHYFRIGSAICSLRIGIYGIYREYLDRAFVRFDEASQAEFEIDVKEDNNYWNSPACEELRRVLRTQIEVSYKGRKYLLAHNSYEEMIFIFDLDTSRVIILVGPEEIRNLACFVTPFRIAIDWLAQRNEAFVIHASVIARDGVGFILNGPSGSGKSTMAALAVKNGLNVVADDVAIVERDSVSSIYRNAKVERSLGRALFNTDYFFELPKDSQGKVIVDLTKLPNTFRERASLGSLIFPKVTGTNCVSSVTKVDALKMMAPNVMREVIGGTSLALAHMSQLVSNVSTHELHLSENAELGFEDLEKIIDIRVAQIGG